MADLEKTGVELVAEGVSDFLSNMGRAEDAVGDFLKKADDGGKGFSVFGEIVTGALRHIGEIAVDAMARAAEATVDFFQDSIKLAGDYEAGLNRFASVAGDSLQEFGFDLDAVSDKALQLGADTQFSADQALEAMTELAKGGVPVVDIMGAATDATLTLASAGEVELAKSAEIVAKSLGVWASEGVTAANVADLMAQAANASTVDVEELALGMYNAQGNAKAAGIAFQDLTTTMALLAPGFGSAADAGTSLKVAITRFVPETKPAHQAMRELGLLTEEAGNAFFDAEGNFVGLREASQLLQDAFKNLTTEERIHYANQIFGQDASRTAILLAEQGAEGYDKMALAMEKAGTATEQAAERNKGFNFALESLNGSIETLKIVIGQALTPALTDLINTALIPAANAVTDVVMALTQAEDPVAELSATMPTLASYIQAATGVWNSLEAAINGVVSEQTAIAAIGTIVERAFGSEAASYVTGFADAIVTLGEYWDVFKGALEGVAALLVGGAIASALSAIGAALAALLSPVGLVAAAVVALGVAWETDFLGIQEITYSVFETLSSAFSYIAGIVSTALEPILTRLATVFTELSTNTYVATEAMNIVNNLASAASNIFEVFATILGAGVAVVGTFGAALVYAFVDNLPTIIDTLVTLGDRVTAVFNYVSQILVGFKDLIVSIFTGDLAGVGEALSSIFSGIFSGIATIIAGAAETILGIIGTLVGSVVSFFQYLYETLVGGSIIPDLVNAIIAWFSQLPSTLLSIATELVTSLISYVSSALPEWVAILAQWAREAWEWLQDAMPTVVQKITEWGTNLLNYVTNTLPQWVGILANWAREAWEWLQDMMPTLLEWLNTYLTNLTNWAMNEVLPAIIEYAKKWASESYEWIKEQAIPGALAGLREFLSEMKAKFDDIRDELAEKGKKVGEAIVKALKKAIKDAKDAIVNLFVDVVNAAIDAAKSALGISSPSKVFYEIGEQTMQGFASGIDASLGAASDSLSHAMQSAISSFAPISVGIADIGTSTIQAVMDSAGIGTQLAGIASGSQIAQSAIYNNQMTRNYNLTVNSQQPSQGIVRDFATISTLAPALGI